MKRLTALNQVAYEKALSSVAEGNQVMIFVHARNDCFRTARAIMDFAIQEDKLSMFETTEHKLHEAGTRDIQKSRNKQIQELWEGGFSTHHAGMLRSDRNLVERLFSQGLIKVLVCTATSPYTSQPELI